jgi:hypothetical protein
MKAKLLFLLVAFPIPALASVDTSAGEWFLFRSRPRVIVRQYRVVPPVVVEAAPVVEEPLVIETIETVRVLRLGPVLVIDDDDDDD